MTEKKVIVKSLEVNYKIIGKGKPFLILHGWGSRYDRWQKVGELLSKKDLKVIIPDLPGFGESQGLIIPWGLDDYVEWVFEFSNLLPELKNGFYLLGNSFGGSVAAKFSIKYTQKVEKLFLVAAACIRKTTFKKIFLEKISKIIKIFYFLPFYNLAKKAFYKLVIGSSDYLRVNGVMKETYLKVISDDLSEKLPFLRVPTVIIWGDKDESTPLYQAKIVNRKIQDSKLIIITGGDHYLQQKMPEVLVRKILENL